MRLQAWHIVVLIVAFVLLFGWEEPAQHGPLHG